MKINGFQKMTLLDFPGKVACTLFTAGCNFRCPFCHNAALVTHIDNSASYGEDEILDYLKRRKGLLDGVCITGGEPLMQPDIAEFAAEIKSLGYALKIDTNGSFPEKLGEIIKGGLADYIAMDIKNSADRYCDTTGKDNLSISDIEKSIDIIMNSEIDYEFRTTVVAQYHSVDEIEKIARRIKGAKAYYLQNFVDSGDLIKEGLCAVDMTELYKMQQIAAQFVVKTEIRGI